MPSRPDRVGETMRQLYDIVSDYTPPEEPTPEEARMQIATHEEGGFIVRLAMSDDVVTEVVFRGPDTQPFVSQEIAGKTLRVPKHKYREIASEIIGICQGSAE